MLRESFIAATLTPEKTTQAAVTKDIGIYLHDFQPQPALISSFKKSSANSNCVAVSTSHIFAAQAEKSVVHVYSRENGNQEAVVPFPERPHCIGLAGASNGPGVLVLGTDGGRVILWELGTGRQISTPQAHLQPTTCLAVDPTSNFLLSGSSDSSLQLWSIPSLLSFSAPSVNDPSLPLPFSPIQTLSNHRAAIVAIEMGHSSSSTNIAASASRDNTCIIWDYLNGIPLHTFLLPSTPLCLALDPADRALYAGYEDGSIQLIDFYKRSSLTHELHDPLLQSTPTQPPPSDRWAHPGESGTAALCLQVSYDGSTILSGHRDGKIQTWDVAKGRYSCQLAEFSAPVTNLNMLAPTGFPNATSLAMKLQRVVKPRYESLLNGATTASIPAIPSNYTITAQFTSTLPLPYSAPAPSSFQAALNHPSFPPSLIEEGLASFATPPPVPTAPKSSTVIPSLDGASSHSNSSSELAVLRAQNTTLYSQLNDALSAQRKAMSQVLEMDKERWERKKDDASKVARKKKRRLRRMGIDEVRRKRIMGEQVRDGEGEIAVEEGEGKGDLSSSTDEMTESD